jgi:2-dehydropantoate 2-reductase
MEPNMSENTYPPLRFLVFGVGAIGTYIGGSLVLAGQDVVFIERPQVANAVRAKGLHLEIEHRAHHVESPAIVHSVEAAVKKGRYDVAILAVKSYDTSRVLEDIKPFKGDLPPFLCLQNGVDNEPALETVLGKGGVIAGTVTSSIARRDAGNIILEKKRGVGIVAGHPLSARFQQAFEKAGLNAVLLPDAAGMKWSKMLTNLMANASSAILDMPPSEIFDDPRMYAFEIKMLREALQVMKKNHIPVLDLPGTPVQAFTWLVKYLPPSLSRPLLKRAMGTGRGTKMPSFHIDLHHGSPFSEVDYLNGAVVRLGRKSGISTPINAKLTNILLALTKKEIPLDTYAGQPEKLIESPTV